MNTFNDALTEKTEKDELFYMLNAELQHPITNARFPKPSDELTSFAYLAEHMWLVIADSVQELGDKGYKIEATATGRRVSWGGSNTVLLEFEQRPDSRYMTLEDALVICLNTPANTLPEDARFTPYEVANIAARLAVAKSGNGIMGLKKSEIRKFAAILERVNLMPFVSAAIVNILLDGKSSNEIPAGD